MDRQDYTAAVLSALRRVTSRERAAIRAELDGHIEDHMEGLLELGYDPDLAEERALAAMGDPREVGRELSRQYPFRWLVVLWGARLLSAWAVLLMLLLVPGVIIDVQETPLLALQERLHPDLSHHFAPSGRIAAEEQLDIEIPLGNDIVRVVRICVYDEIPWGERRAYINVDSYDQRPLGLVSGKDLLLESQGGGEAVVRVSGSNRWWYTGDGAVDIAPGDTYVTLRCEAYGESHVIRIPLPEGGAP